MCFPASFVVTKGRVYWSRNTESHEETIRENGLREINVRGDVTLVRVELLPPDDVTVPLKDWIYCTEQDILPPWYDEKEVEKRVRKVLPQWYKAKVVGPGQYCPLHAQGQIFVWGGWVEYVSENAVVSAVSHGGKIRQCAGRVYDVYSGTIEQVLLGGVVDCVAYDGRVDKVLGGMIEDVRHGGSVGVVAMTCMHRGTVNVVFGGKIEEVRGGIVLAVQPGAPNGPKSIVEKINNGGTVISYTPLPHCQVLKDGVLIDRSEKKGVTVSKSVDWKLRRQV